ncbi:MAG: hypothetical protein V7K98_08980 [Nostoc sp.]|uniref:hypothetical protein n=1 Tax=Nostoc sp. TaxID=1180 RepID=UPI002FF5656A
MPNSQCPIPNSQCPMPNAQFPIPILCHLAAVVAVWKEVEKFAVAIGNFKGCFPLLSPNF